jgi:mannose/fructose/N-acetylgalactosamine-specific phosphotransferase system component IIC
LAVLELDVALAAQTLISRPFVVGVLLGALAGAPEMGALFGAAFELLSLGDLPLGGHLTWSTSVAAGVSSLLAGGGCAFPVSLAAGIFAGLIHSRIEAFERAQRVATGEVLAGLAVGGGASLGRALGGSLAIHAAMTFAVSLSVLALGETFNRQWWPLFPEFVRGGVSFAADNAPWIALSGVAAWGLRRM